MPVHDIILRSVDVVTNSVTIECTNSTSLRNAQQSS